MSADASSGSGGAWALSSSSASPGSNTSASAASSSSSSAASGSGEIVLLGANPAAPKRRGRGRPRKSDDALALALAHSEAQQPCPSTTRSVIEMLRPVGGELHRLAVSVAKLQIDTEISARTHQLVHHFMGPNPRVLMPSSAEARHLGHSLRTFKRQSLELASATFIASRAWIGSICSKLLMEADRGTLRIHGTYSHWLYDETPLTMRGCSIQHASFGRINPEQESLESICDAATPEELLLGGTTTKVKAKSDTGVCKLLQAEMTLAVLVQSTTSRTMMLQLPCALPLHWVNRGTAEAIKTCLDENLNVPAWHALQNKSELNLDLTCSDRASANDKVETIRTSSGVLRGFVCHVRSTSARHAKAGHSGR